MRHGPKAHLIIIGYKAYTDKYSNKSTEEELKKILADHAGWIRLVAV